ADGPEVKAVSFPPCDKPHLRLAAADAVVFGPLILGKLRELPAEVDDVLVAIDPVVEDFELGDEFLLGCADLVHQPALRHRVPPGPSSITMPSAASWSRMRSAAAKSRRARAA